MPLGISRVIRLVPDHITELTFRVSALRLPERTEEIVILAKLKVILGLIAVGFSTWGLMQAFNPGSKNVQTEVFTTITGQQVSLREWRGQPVIVTFWATDCPSCMREIPHLVDLYRYFHPFGLEIIAVAMAYDPPSHVVEMTRSRKLPYHVALDLHSAHALAFGDVKFTPTTYLISPDGDIVNRSIGIFDYPAWKDQIAKMLKIG